MTFAKPSESIQTNLFTQVNTPTSVAEFVTPETYRGLAAFHKYWGKKPAESLSYLIENFSEKGDIVMDPFLGSGFIAKESLERGRRFVGIDVNPFSIEHSSFLLELPSAQDYFEALSEIEHNVADEINRSYMTSDDRIASHYLWEKDEIASVWIKSMNGKTRIEVQPSPKDYSLHGSYQDYEPKHFRNLTFFTNSRINVKPSMSICDIFTGRAMRNIDLILGSIAKYPRSLKRALLLTLTSSSGQMSNMVFAIKNRRAGKQNGSENKVEVGSWVIGFWIPETHFEINAWNCFKNRASKLLKTLLAKKHRSYAVSNDISKIHDFNYEALLVNEDCRNSMLKMPEDSVALVCTDPPHSDRVPYLELSELWNSLLGYNVDFNREIVVSNAKERQKSKRVYNAEMTDFFRETIRILKYSGYIALFFNARDSESWQYLKSIENISCVLKFVGSFPMSYSATSVVQDNRKGAMKNDFVLIYQKQRVDISYELPKVLSSIPDWSPQFPENK